MLYLGHGVHTTTIFIFSIDDELYVNEKIIIETFYPHIQKKDEEIN